MAIRRVSPASGLPVTADSVDGFAGPLGGGAGGAGLGGKIRSRRKIRGELCHRRAVFARRSGGAADGAVEDGRTRSRLRRFERARASGVRVVAGESARGFAPGAGRGHAQGGYLDRAPPFGRASNFPALPYDPFFNVNSPEDLTEAERLVARRNSTQ